jgi:hypothetical protein
MITTTIILQLLVVVLTTDLGDYYSVVTAFGPSLSLPLSLKTQRRPAGDENGEITRTDGRRYGRILPLPSSLSTHTRTLDKHFAGSISTTQLSLSSDNEDDHQLLLDESVLLYSQVLRQQDIGDTEVENDIEILRKNELTTLVEDVVFDAAAGMGDNNAAETTVELEEEEETLMYVSQSLDHQILLGYQSTFTEDEFDRWVQGIDSLYMKIQTQLAALPSASSLLTEATTATTNNANMKKTTTLAQLHVRLESMRTLIDPVGKGRLRLPLAQPMVVQSLHKDTTVSPLETKMEVTNIESDSAIIDALSEKDLRNVTTNTENKNEDIQPRNTSISDDKVDKEILREYPGDITTMIKEVVTEKTVKALKPDQKEKHTNNEIKTKLIVGSSISDGNVTRNTATAGSFSNMTQTTSKSTLDSTIIHAASNSSTFEKSNYAITTSPIIITNITHNNYLSTAVSHNHEVMANEKGEGEGPDVVSTVVTAVVLGAAAVTKLPFLVAGVALGPVIRDSIVYAKSRMENSTTSSPPSIFVLPDSENNSTKK